MIEVVDGFTAEPIGVQYDADESGAVVFTLSLYANQLAAGNIVDIDEGLPIGDILQLTGELCKEIKSGLTTVNWRQHQAITDIFLPYTVRMHDGLPIKMYGEVCDVLCVKPFDLFYNAMIARRMLGGESMDLKIISDEIV